MNLNQNRWHRFVCRLMLVAFFYQCLLPVNVGFYQGKWHWSFGPKVAYADTPQPSSANATHLTSGPSLQAFPPLPFDISDPSYLDATPDANSSDTYIIQKAADLNHDPDQIFAFVRDQIGYESYQGSLRGARGTLWSKAGNSLDKASLLVALLRASGIPARYATGHLGDDDAKKLILSMFPALQRVVGCTDDGANKADPANDAKLLAENRTHYWAEFAVGGAFQTADPSFDSAQLGQTFAVPIAQFIEVPVELRHQVRFLLKREITTPLANLFSGGGFAIPDLLTVLDQRFPSVDLVGNPVSIGHWVNSKGINALFSLVTNTYSPYLLLGQSDEDISDDPIIRGDDYQEILTNFTGGSHILTGLFLTMEVTAPDGTSQSYERTLVDRIGLDIRTRGGSPSISLDPSGPTALTTLDLATINVISSRQEPLSFATQLTRLQTAKDKLDALQTRLDAIPKSGPVTDEQRADQSLGARLAANLAIVSSENNSMVFGLAADRLEQQLELGYLSQIYTDSPRLILTQIRKDGNSVQAGMDLRKNTVRAISAPGQLPNASQSMEVIRGMLESTLEGKLLGDTFGQGARTFADVFAQLQPDNALQALVPGDDAKLDNLAISPGTKALIGKALQEGRAVVTPGKMVEVNGKQTLAWLESEWGTGYTVGVLEDGSHGAIAEYAGLLSGILDSDLNVKMGTFIGTVNGWAVSQILFTTELLNHLFSDGPVENAIKNAKNALAKPEAGKKSLLEEAASMVLGYAAPNVSKIIDAGNKALGCFNGTLLAFDKTNTSSTKFNDITSCLKSLYKTVLGIPEVPGNKLADAFKAGFTAGLGMGYQWITRNFPGDPPVYPILSTDLAEPNAITPGTAPGVALLVGLDPLFTLFHNDAEIPTVFKAQIQNTGATTAKFKISIAGGNDFAYKTSVNEVTVPAGKTGEIGVCARPTGNLGAPNSSSPFQVSVESLTDPGVTASQPAQVLIPEVAGISIIASPTVLNAAPGQTVNATLNLKAVGNLSATIDLSAELPAGLNLTGLSQVQLNPGESTSLPFSLTPDANTPINTVLTAKISAASGSEPAKLINLPVKVEIPGAVPAALAAEAAGQAGNSDLANTLTGLGAALNHLATSPTDPVYKSQTLALLKSLSLQVSALGGAGTSIASQLLSVYDEIANANQSSSLFTAIDNLGSVLASLPNFLDMLGLYGFDLSIEPSSRIAEPQTPVDYTVVIRNRGSKATTYNLRLFNTNLPAGVTATFFPATLSLSPGEITGGPGITPVTLRLTQTSATRLAPFDFTVMASTTDEFGVQTGVEKTSLGSMNVRAELISVVSVTTDPAFTDPGTSVQVSARLLNAVNQEKTVLVGYSLVGPANQTVYTSSPVQTQLGVLASLKTVDLGFLDTTGLELGDYRVQVLVTELDGQPIPNATGTGQLLLGSPVSGKLSVEPTVIPPFIGYTGQAAVLNHLSIQGKTEPPAAFELLGQAPVSAANSVTLKGTTAYVCTANGISLFDVTAPAIPQFIKSFGFAGAHHCKVDGDRLFAFETDTGGFGFKIHLYSVADVQNPVELGVSPQPVLYSFPVDLLISGNRGYLSQNQFCYLIFGHDIYAQNGDVLSFDFSNPSSPSLTDVLFNTNSDTSEGGGCPQNGGDNNVLQLALASPQTLLATSTTSTGTNTQIGTARILVVDVDDPANLNVVRELQIPGMLLAVGIAIDGDKALVIGSSGGWNDFGADLGLTGKVVLAKLDISDPRNPQLLSTQTLDRASRGLGGLTKVGNGLFVAASQGSVDDEPTLLLVDANNTNNLLASPFIVPTNVENMALDGDILYTVSTSGLLSYHIGNTVGTGVVARVNLPKSASPFQGVFVIPNSFNSPPNETIQGADFDTITFKRTLYLGQNSLDFTWYSAVEGLKAGESLSVTLGGTVDFSLANGSGSFALTETKVTAEQMLSLAPGTATVPAGQPTSYQVTITNPTGLFLFATLQIKGIPTEWVDGFNTDLSLAPNSSVTRTLTLTSDANAIGSHQFNVVLNSNTTDFLASVTGSLNLLSPATSASTALGLVIGLTPSTSTAGRGNSAHYTIRLTNTGNTTETFNLSAALPAELMGQFDQDNVQVPPGVGNYRDVGLTLTSGLGTSAADYPFTVQASFAATGDIGSSAQGLLTVVNAGVSLAFDQAFGAPGDTLLLRVTNTGTVEDTFDLALTGPGGIISTLTGNPLHLLAGGFDLISIVLGNVDFSLPGSLDLFVNATSQYDNVVKSSAKASIQIEAQRSMTATIEPPLVLLSNPGNAHFALQVRNTGNTEDAYSAVISTSNGPVTASLQGLDGTATQIVPIFRLPALSTGTIGLDAILQQYGGGSITVDVVSQSDPGIYTSPVASIRTTVEQPVADAGSNTNVFTSVKTNLDGSSSHDPQQRALTFAWSFDQVPTGSQLADNLIVEGTTPKPSFIPDVPGTYRLKLIVNNGIFDSDPAYVVITAAAANVPPNAVASTTTSNVTVNSQVFVEGKDSNDPDQGPQALSFQWSLFQVPTGSQASLSNSNQTKADFIPDLPGDYILTLQVSDGAASSTDQITIVAEAQNVPPNANAGADQSVNLGATVALDGSNSNDPDHSPQSLSYAWHFVTKPAGSLLTDGDIVAQIPGGGSPKAAFQPDVVGQYLLQLQVSDGVPPPATDNVIITVINPLVYRDVSNLVNISTSNTRSTLDRTNRRITTTATVMLTNLSTKSISMPFEGLLKATSPQVVMPEAGGIKADGSFFYNLEGRVGKAEFSPGDSVKFDIKFVYPSSVRFSYEIRVFGMATDEQP